MPTIPYKRKDGSKVSGVTTIIGGSLGWNKEALKHWAWKQGMDGRDYRQITKDAADAGTIAHYLIECDLKGIEPDLKPYLSTPELLALAQAAYQGSFLPWKQMVRFEPIAIEPHLVSETYGYGLTPDMIARVLGHVCVFDWKTSNGLYPEMIIQVSAYANGWTENNPDTPIEGGAYLLRIDKESASFHFHHWADLSKPWEVFQHLLAIHNLRNTLKRMT